MPSGSLPPVQADPVRISQVLGNLISYALKHTSSGGFIEIKCFESSSIKPGASPGNSSYIWTTVADNGEGINPEDLAYVFDRFYRADRSRNRRTGGRGLGLAIVRQIIESHGGEVWAEARLGEGSTFGYSLPIR